MAVQPLACQLQRHSAWPPWVCPLLNSSFRIIGFFLAISAVHALISAVMFRIFYILQELEICSAVGFEGTTCRLQFRQLVPLICVFLLLLLALKPCAKHFQCP